MFLFRAWEKKWKKIQISTFREQFIFNFKFNFNFNGNFKFNFNFNFNCNLSEL